MATQKQKDDLAKLQANCPHTNVYRYWYDENHLMNVCRNCFHKWEEQYRPFLLGDYSNLTAGCFSKNKSDDTNYDIHCKKYGIGKYSNTRSNEEDFLYMANRNIKLQGDEENLSPLELIMRGYIQGASDMQDLS